MLRSHWMSRRPDQKHSKRRGIMGDLTCDVVVVAAGAAVVVVVAALF